MKSEGSPQELKVKSCASCTTFVELYFRLFWEATNELTAVSLRWERPVRRRLVMVAAAVQKRHGTTKMGLYLLRKYS